MTPYPERLNRFRVELEKAVALDLDRSRRRSRIVRPIAAALTLAAVIGVVGSIVLSGGGPSVVERAEAALAAPSGQPLHMVMIGTTRRPDGGVVRWRDEEWLISGSVAPRRAVQTNADGHRFETAMTDDGLAELYDPASNTVYAAPVAIDPADRPDLERRTLSPQERVKVLLAGGDLTDEGHLSVDGRDAIRLVTKGGEVTYLVDPDTYAPIELRAKLDGGGEVDLRFPVYEQLSASALSDGQFSLAAQHPGAVVKVDKLAYEAQWSRLAPEKP